MQNDRILIKPTDYMADFDEIADGSEPRSRCRYFVEPYTSNLINEVCEANYYPGNRVPYHEHATGFETFLVDNGSLEISIRSRKSLLNTGDIVHLPPYTPHSILALEDNTIWRAFHQGLEMTPNMMDERQLRDLYPDLFFAPTFHSVNAARRNSVWFDYKISETRDVPKSDIPEIRPFDFALADYAFEGIELKLKVGRWETAGAKEVWQLRIKKGFTMSWEPGCPLSHLYDIYSGKVELKVDGVAETMIAEKRDLLHIPKFVAGSITALEDTVIYDAGCQGFLTRLMDEMRFYQVNEPEKLKDKDFVREIMKKHDYYVFFGL